MTDQKDQEIEAKLYVRSLKRVERLLETRARLRQPRVFELNRRFDLPDGSLGAAGRVLRLRQDQEVHLTYKDRATLEQGVMHRTELEVTVSDMETARKLLHALGYIQSAVYEKYRTEYETGGCHVALDELPYGHFVEIEGPDRATVAELASQLGLDMAKAVEMSYLALFERYARPRGLDSRQLTFDAIAPLTIQPEDLGVTPADSAS